MHDGLVSRAHIDDATDGAICFHDGQVPRVLEFFMQFDVDVVVQVGGKLGRRIAEVMTRVDAGIIFTRGGIGAQQHGLACGVVRGDVDSGMGKI